MCRKSKTNKITSATDRNLSRNADSILQQIDREKLSASQIYKLDLWTEKKIRTQNSHSRRSLEK